MQPQNHKIDFWCIGRLVLSTPVGFVHEIVQDLSKVSPSDDLDFSGELLGHLLRQLVPIAIGCRQVENEEPGGVWSILSKETKQRAERDTNAFFLITTDYQKI